MEITACSPRAQEVDVGRVGIQGHPFLYRVQEQPKLYLTLSLKTLSELTGRTLLQHLVRFWHQTPILGDKAKKENTLKNVLAYFLYMHLVSVPTEYIYGGQKTT